MVRLDEKQIDLIRQFQKSFVKLSEIEILDLNVKDRRIFKNPSSQENESDSYLSRGKRLIRNFRPRPR